MVATSKELKVLVPQNMHKYIETAAPDTIHITAFCVNNLVAMKPPLLIILTGLKNLPDELKMLASSGKIWVASSQSGWMDREIFLCWCINFINWLANYRCSLPLNICTKPALIVLDGHVSRECPAALYLLRSSNVNVVVLPFHTTHLLQLFDVVLASPLKAKLTQNFASYRKLGKFKVA